MHWLRLQLPVLYLASILLAGALPCASHAAANEAGSAFAHQENQHHPQRSTGPEHEVPCHSGEVVCGCEAATERLQSAVANSRDEMAAPAIAHDGAGIAEAEGHLPVSIGDPPERQSHSTSFYDGIHGRSARLLI